MVPKRYGPHDADTRYIITWLIILLAVYKLTQNPVTDPLLVVQVQAIPWSVQSRHTIFHLSVSLLAQIYSVYPTVESKSLKFGIYTHTHEQRLNAGAHLFTQVAPNS